MPDLLFQNLSTVQSDKQPAPATIPSATTIAPTTFITKLLGTTTIVNITPPVTGSHMLVLIPSGANTLATTGNVLVGATTVLIDAKPVLLFYDPSQAKYLRLI